MNYVHVTDPDDENYGRYGRLKDQQGDSVVLYLIHFYTGDGEPRAWLFAYQFTFVEAIPNQPAISLK